LAHSGFFAPLSSTVRARFRKSVLRLLLFFLPSAGRLAASAARGRFAANVNTGANADEEPDVNTDASFGQAP
jgi:hypothetical protein